MRRFAWMAPFLFLSAFPPILRAAFEEKPASARTAGLAEAGTAAGGVESLFYNPAALRFSPRAELLSTRARLLALEDLPLTALAWAAPSRRLGAWGLGYLQFGAGAYREQEASLAHGFFLAPGAAVGWRLKYSRLDLRRYGSASAIGLDVGAAGRVHSTLDLGFSFHNANHPRLAGAGSDVPQSLRAGAALRPTARFLTLLDAVKPVRGKFSWRLGQEVRLSRPLALRFGAETRPDRFSIGTGWERGLVRVDYAFLSHPRFNDQHQVSFVLSWGRVDGKGENAESGNLGR